MELCFGAKIRKILGIPLLALHTKVLLPYIKVGFGGIYLTQTCYPDVNADLYLKLLETGNIREFGGTSIFPVSLDSICGVNGFQQGSNKQFLWAREKYMRYHTHQSFVSPAPM